MANKIAVLGLSSILLVAAVIGVVTVSKRGGESSDGTENLGGGISTTTKSVESICKSTDYKDTCTSTLAPAAGNISDPKELIKLAFNVAVEHISSAMANSSVLQQAETDPRTHDAFENCKELLNDSMDDLRDSMDKFSNFDVTGIDEFFSDLKTWLSGALTFQGTCLDGFENTTGDSGEKMKKLLQVSGELTRNGLAMVDAFADTITNLNLSALTGRRLLSDDGLPSWIDAGKRSLLEAPATAFTQTNVNGPLTPKVTVALDGSGDVKTIAAALLRVPKKNKTPFVIHIKAGIYQEYLEIGRKMSNVVLIGDGPTKTRITGNKNFVDGINTFRTSTVVVQGNHFFAKGIGFENSAGAKKHQAVALRVSSDMAMFYQCDMDGYQDTLYVHVHRQYYRECKISGTIDFIFGDANSLFQNCTMIVRQPLENQGCMVTAQGRDDKRENTGIVLQKCTISAAPEFTSSPYKISAYLGRPWKQFSRTIIMQTQIDGFIDPTGWAPWAGSFGIDTLFYSEYANTGPGADKSNRVKWAGIKTITAQDAVQFTGARFIAGNLWVKPSGVPYDAGM
ncbi:probable pectinesterase/pectinesterase inhibitor 21 [Impatiens glandulifera]|uniref:probable pectinesterase/pectinesterase inhibitor 21 n=1 Tax=Impatiens glandulifera TaxID=253017 RepID=UPI001FB091AE|nr:probable pectinesterase/pectinesterase inhibitor 21 [Impatiens glandulifera]